MDIAWSIVIVQMNKSFYLPPLSVFVFEFVLWGRLSFMRQLVLDDWIFSAEYCPIEFNLQFLLYVSREPPGHWDPINSLAIAACQVSSFSEERAPNRSGNSGFVSSVDRVI